MNASSSYAAAPACVEPSRRPRHGASTADERSRALDLLGFEKQLVFPTFAMGQFAYSTDLDVLYAGTDMVNRAMNQFCSADDRLLAVGFAPLLDPQLALEAVRDGPSRCCKV